MKIKNDNVTLRIGKKQYNFNNLILDEYLKRFASAQLDSELINVMGVQKKLTYCLLKFDTPLNFDSTSEIKNQDFDICFMGGSIINQELTEKQIVAEYFYNTNSALWNYKKSSDDSIQNYYGKKIVAIGFNSTWIPYTDNWKYPVCSILDTSNYNIYLQEKQDLSVARKDVITTDALFYSRNKNKVPAPAHLCPSGLPQIINQPKIYNDDKTLSSSFYNNAFGILYSIGLSSHADGEYLNEEFPIKDLNVTNEGTEILIKGIENYLNHEESIFPSENLYSGSNLYPRKSNYKYVIFKYKVWQIVHSGTYDDITSTPTDTGYYYYQAIPINKFGKNNLKIKYERG